MCNVGTMTVLNVGTIKAHCRHNDFNAIIGTIKVQSRHNDFNAIVGTNKQENDISNSSYQF